MFGRVRVGALEVVVGLAFVLGALAEMQIHWWWIAERG